MFFRFKGHLRFTVDTIFLELEPAGRGNRNLLKSGHREFICLKGIYRAVGGAGHKLVAIRLGRLHLLDGSFLNEVVVRLGSHALFEDLYNKLVIKTRLNIANFGI